MSRADDEPPPRATSTALTRACIERIEHDADALHCFVTRCFEAALDDAAAADRRAAAGAARSPIDGLPIAIKDNIDVAGVRTSNGSRGERVATRDAAVSARLRAAGAVVLGKLNMHEGALGTSSDNPHHGRVGNPRRAGHSPGGSSGGSAAAVAAGLCHAALGTDTMGSVRLPAALCGVVGLKPTWSANLLEGVAPLATQLDHVGPLAPDVASTRALAQVLDPGLAAAAPVDLSRLQVATLELDAVELDELTRGGWERSLARLREAGLPVAAATVRLADVDLGAARRAGLLLVEQAAAAALDRGTLGPAGDYSATFLALLDYGRRASDERLATARARVARAAAALDSVLARIDLLISPTCPHAAPLADQPPPASSADLTALANFAGCPAISIPAPVDADALPVGLQLVSARGGDARLLDCAAAIEGCFASPSQLRDH